MPRADPTGDAVGAARDPGWDYYLDRMVAAGSGGDLTAIDFNDYYPAFAAYYRAELS